MADGEKDVIIGYLSELVETTELYVDNLDDWAFSSHFLDSLSLFKGKNKLQISYSRSVNIKKAKERIIKREDFNIKFIQRESGYFICWQFGEFRVYGIPEKKNVIDNYTFMVVTKYYLEKIENS